QMVERGFFPCSALQGKVAIDINTLELARIHQLTQAPNETAFAEALEASFQDKLVQLDSRVSRSHDSLRRRFSDCLRWYTHL
ncbi:hypothetical protein SISNIDRAFT_400384, partial [Sistotremastrum niveocremeum HHB9708]